MRDTEDWAIFRALQREAMGAFCRGRAGSGVSSIPLCLIPTTRQSALNEETIDPGARRRETRVRHVRQEQAGSGRVDRRLVGVPGGPTTVRRTSAAET